MKHTTNPTAKQSQKWILQALLDLMVERDYDKISVSEICRKAEVDRRTFYRNFDSKEDVLKQYIEQLRSEYIAEFQKIMKPDRYYATLLFFQFWHRHAAFIKNMDHCGLSSYIFDQFKKFSESEQALLSGREEAGAETNYILAYKIGGFWNVMLTWIEKNTEISPEELAAIILQA